MWGYPNSEKEEKKKSFPDSIHKPGDKEALMKHSTFTPQERAGTD
jgi:hypothetical protein